MGEENPKEKKASTEKVKEAAEEPKKEIPSGPRFTGSCKWFNVLKGFGFITQDITNQELFVHQSELQMPGFRSLDEGERVSFSVRDGKKGLEAFHVAAEVEGEQLEGSSVRPLGKKKHKLIRCYKCGQYGSHVAAKCKAVEETGKLCYECHEAGHLVGNCPKKLERLAALSLKREKAAEKAKEVAARAPQ